MDKVKPNYSKEELERLFIVGSSSVGLSKLQECVYTLFVAQNVGVNNIASQLAINLDDVNSVIQSAKRYLQGL